MKKSKMQTALMFQFPYNPLGKRLQSAGWFCGKKGTPNRDAFGKPEPLRSGFGLLACGSLGNLMMHADHHVALVFVAISGESHAINRWR